MRRRLLAAVFGGALCVAAQSAAAQQSAQPADENPVVARVDGSEIRFQDVVDAARSLPPQYRNMPIQQLFPPLLQQLVQKRVMANAAAAANLADDPDVKRRLDLVRDDVLAQAYVAKTVEAAATDEAIKARYDKELATAPKSEEIRARHILVESMEQAEALLGQIRNGAEFEALAKEHSTGPSGAKGGDLGFFDKGTMVPEFSEAAFALQPGEVSQPVKTQFGWHIIKVEERRVGQPASLADREEELRDAISREAVEQLVETLVAGAKIETFNPDGSPLGTGAGPKPAE